MAALEEGVITPDFRVSCGGGATFYGRFFQCHKKGGHGSVDLREAMEKSCNVYYYTIGNMTGVDKIHKWATLLGLGDRSGIDLPNEVTGLVPSTEWKRRTTGEKWYPGETISVAIGLAVSVTFVPALIGETEQLKYGNNLNELLARFGVEIQNTTVQDYEHHHQAPSWVLAQLEQPEHRISRADLLAGVASACFYRAGTLALHITNGAGAHAIARTHSTATLPDVPLAAILEHGAGRVVVLADSDLFGDDCIGELDHEALWINLLYWAAGGAFARTGAAPSSAAAESRTRPSGDASRWTTRPTT